MRAPPSASMRASNTDRSGAPGTTMAASCRSRLPARGEPQRFVFSSDIVARRSRLERPPGPSSRWHGEQLTCRYARTRSPSGASGVADPRLGEHIPPPPEHLHQAGRVLDGDVLKRRHPLHPSALQRPRRRLASSRHLEITIIIVGRDLLAACGEHRGQRQHHPALALRTHRFSIRVPIVAGTNGGGRPLLPGRRVRQRRRRDAPDARLLVPGVVRAKPDPVAGRIGLRSSFFSEGRSGRTGERVPHDRLQGNRRHSHRECHALARRGLERDRAAEVLYDGPYRGHSDTASG